MDPTTAIINIYVIVFTIGILSIMYKVNPLYRLAQAIIVGAGAGYALAWTIAVLNGQFTTIIAKANYIMIIPTILGLTYFLRFSRKYSWVSRYPSALTIGIGISLALVTGIRSQFIGQLQATILPLNTPDLFLDLSRFFLVVGVCASVSYFIFTREQTGFWGYWAKLGRYVLMASFGAQWSSEAQIFNGFFIGPMYEFVQAIRSLVGA